MNKIFRLFLTTFFIFFLCSCISQSAKIIVSTKSQIEDFQVKCTHTEKYLIGHNASGKMVMDKTISAKSNEDISCGLFVTGQNSRASVDHPTYESRKLRWDSTPNKVNNGVEIFEFVHWKEKNKIAKELLEKGYWGDKADPVAYYLQNLASCSIFYTDISKYGEEGNKGYSKLREKYYNDILECNRENEIIRHSFDRSKYYFYYILSSDERGNAGAEMCGEYNCRGKRLYLPNSIDRSMKYGFRDDAIRGYKLYFPELTIKDKMNYRWGRKIWGEYLTGTDNDIDALTKSKKTYYVAIRDLGDFEFHKNKAVWLKLDANNRNEVNKIFNSAAIFKIEPTWLSNYEKDKFIKNCDGGELHIDISKVSDKLRKNTHIYATGGNPDYCYNPTE